ncbi:hypothetical protein ONZ45_g19597 [Pleurotus djamor]|nr:hypothetical protein ONZ45_g19597 [Pleurotus djamor]
MPSLPQLPGYAEIPSVLPSASESFIIAWIPESLGPVLCDTLIQRGPGSMTPEEVQDFAVEHLDHITRIAAGVRLEVKRHTKLKKQRAKQIRREFEVAQANIAGPSSLARTSSKKRVRTLSNYDSSGTWGDSDQLFTVEDGNPSQCAMGEVSVGMERLTDVDAYTRSGNRFKFTASTKGKGKSVDPAERQAAIERGFPPEADEAGTTRKRKWMGKENDDGE